MIIRTSTIIKAPKEQLWPLLTNSEMSAPGCFCLGVPRPVECRLPDEVGGVGSERQCISDRGVVNQKITNWQPPEELQFSMANTDHSWSRCVESIDERFQLEHTDKGTKIVRTTTLKASGRLRCIKEAAFYIGLKRVHFFVFKNWRVLAEQ